MRNFFLNTLSGWLTSLLQTVTVPLLNCQRELFSPSTKGTCEPTGSRWGYTIYEAAWQHREQISGVIFFTHFCLTHFYLVLLSPFFALLIPYFHGSCWNNFFPLTSSKSQHITHFTTHCCRIVTICLYHLFFLSFQLQWSLSYSYEKAIFKTRWTREQVKTTTIA